MSAVLESTDYRRALVAAIASQGRLQRDVAREVGRSEGWLSNILNGQRRLDPGHVDELAAALALSAEESRYLAALVDLESPSSRVRDAAWSVVAAAQRQRAAGRFTEDIASAFAAWHVGAIANLARCEGFRPDAEWIAATLDPPIAKTQAQDAVTLLVRLGLLLPDGAGGLCAGPVTWSPSDLPPGPVSVAAAELHQSALRLAQDALHTARFNERHCSSTTLAIPEAKLPVFLAKLQELERQMLGDLGEASVEPPNRVYLLGIQLFPVSRYTDADPL